MGSEDTVGVRLGTSLRHFGEDFLDFAEDDVDDVVLLDFPELLVFSDCFGVVELGRKGEGREDKERKRRTKVGVEHREWIRHATKE